MENVLETFKSGNTHASLLSIDFKIGYECAIIDTALKAASTGLITAEQALALMDAVKKENKEKMPDGD